MSLLPPVPEIPYKDITQLINGNLAFKNPLGEFNALALSKANGLKTFVTAASDPLNPLYNSEIAANTTQIINSVNNLINTFNRFTSHTNNLSGISLSTGLTGANFATITTIVSTVQRYRNDGGICQIVNGAFGAIQNASAIATQIAQLIGFIDNVLTIPNQIADKMDFMRGLLENQIESDLISFASAQLDALQLSAAAAISSLINNDCIADVLTKVGTQELKNVIREKGRDLF
jgi:hypothetical protein